MAIRLPRPRINQAWEKDLSLMGDATINAGSGLIGDGLQFPTNEPGDTGRAGVNGWAQRPGDDDDYDFGASDYTIQTWINYSDTSDESSIIEKFGGSGDGWATTSFPQNSGFQLFHNAADGRLLRNDSHGVAPIPGWPNPTGWQHIVTLRRGDDLEIYANGSVVASANIVTDLGGSAGEPVTDNSLPLVLGYRADPADPRGFALNGSFDEVAIWTRALESEEITTLYNSGAGNPIDVMQITEVSWQNDVSGDWNATGNWSPGIVPDATNITAILGDAIQSTQTVFTNTDVTVQAMHFDNTNSYVVAGGGSMTFDSGTTAPQSDVNVFAGDHQFQAVVNLNNQTDLTIVSDASLAFINILNLDGNTLTKSGPGTLSVNNNLVAGRRRHGQLRGGHLQRDGNDRWRPE